MVDYCLHRHVSRVKCRNRDRNRNKQPRRVESVIIDIGSECTFSYFCLSFVQACSFLFHIPNTCQGRRRSWQLYNHPAQLTSTTHHHRGILMIVKSHHPNSMSPLPARLVLLNHCINPMVAPIIAVVALMSAIHCNHRQPIHHSLLHPLAVFNR